MRPEVAEISTHLRRFSIEIGASPGVIYDCWTRIEQLPRLSPAILRVKRIDASHMLYEAVDTLGCRRLWDLRILERVPGHRLAWRSECGRGAASAGWAELTALPGARTQLDVGLDYRPSSFLERVADALGWIDAGIRGDLQRFARHVEAAQEPSLVESAAGAQLSGSQRH